MPTSDPPSIPQADRRMLEAAAFLAQALSLGDDAAAVAADLSPIDGDGAVAVFAGEFESSVGPAAFLVYAYELTGVDLQGRTGRARFGEDLATLETAARVEAPGPRVLAHTETDADGFILATSPAVLRALTGASSSGAPVPDADHARLSVDGSETRRNAALELLRLLRLADHAAGTWLAAAESSLQSDTPPPTAAHAAIEFSPEETELALFLLDERSIQLLLTALNAVLNVARARASATPAADT